MALICRGEGGGGERERRMGTGTTRGNGGKTGTEGRKGERFSKCRSQSTAYFIFCCKNTIPLISLTVTFDFVGEKPFP